MERAHGKSLITIIVYHPYYRAPLSEEQANSTFLGYLAHLIFLKFI